MTAATTRLGLTKPGGGSTGLILPPDPVDIDVLNANFDKIDDAIGFKNVTSVTRPSGPFDGQPILETDTGLLRVFRTSGTLWEAPNPIVVVSDLDALNGLAASAYEGRIIGVDSLNVCFQAWDNVWVQQGVATAATAAARDTEYAKAGGIFKVLGVKCLALDTNLTSTYINGTLGWLVDINTVAEGIVAAASNLGASAAGVTVDLVAAAFTHPAMPFPTIIELDYLSVVTQSAAATRGYTAQFTATAGALTAHYTQRSGEPAGGSSIQIAWTLGARATLVLPANTAADVKLTGTPSDNGMTVAASQYRYRRRTS